ncbi:MULTISPECIES: hypothetical protein [Oceanobacillus]|uniref:Uncharacterized protein n=1 Tax=Oceanobacillus aidingensis TaxID=645964 RepID=A0ABV9JX73_9BACI|nr:hypothetical protein [Oceanobacillus oncorhynchi]MDM8099947.1 hypothetical protein [Oceanobacillus oncorhynchi]UUI40493.1 hypothetical protein NP440_02585 [Oceanobacillus oncorhynchi]
METNYPPAPDERGVIEIDDFDEQEPLSAGSKETLFMKLMRASTIQ